MPATPVGRHCGSPFMATAASGQAHVGMNADPHSVAGMARSYIGGFERSTLTAGKSRASPPCR